MQASEKAIKLIKNSEGFTPQAYYCPANVLTIGYGHAIDTKLERYTSISVQQAHDILTQDLKRMERAITEIIKVRITQGQFDALCSLVYNWGIGAFSRSKALRFINQGKFNEAALELFGKEKGVVKIKGVFSQGLYNRRLLERRLWNE